jgi:CRP/FNR family transcriptional regulator, nitrogen oxide reductase regulator
MELKEKIDLLRKSAIFSVLTEAELGELSRFARERNLKAGEFLIREDENCQFFYILMEGRLRTFLYSSLGKELTLITYLSPGDVLGPMSIFRNRPPSGSMKVLSSTRVLEFKQKDVIPFILNHPPVMLEMIKVLAARVSELNRRLRDMAGERVEQRLFRLMLMLSHRFGPALNITRRELAEMVGATIETTIRILSSMKKEKIIASSRGKIVILDETRLRSLSEGLC